MTFFFVTKNRFCNAKTTADIAVDYYTESPYTDGSVIVVKFIDCIVIFTAIACGFSSFTVALLSSFETALIASLIDFRIELIIKYAKVKFGLGAQSFT